MKTFFLATLALVALFASRFAHAADEWPQWRGPDGQGHVASTGLPLEWSETKNVTWKTPLPGRGHSSPVISGDEIWLTAAEETPATEEQKKKKLTENTGNQPLVVVGKLSLRAICVDRKSGQVVANLELLSEENPDWTHAINTFASPTPILENGRLYCHFGTHGNACVDTKSKKVLWTNTDLHINHENGPGSTPVLDGDNLIFHCDGSDAQYIAALNKHTGKLAWKKARSGELRSDPQLRKAYGTPLVVKIDNRDVLLSPGADWLYAYDPQTGEELWKLSYETLGFSIVPRPVAGHGMIFFSTSFMRAEVLAVRYEGNKPEIAWRYSKQAPRVPSPLLVGEELYLASDNGVVTCLDAKTGEEHWAQRLGGNFVASPTFADGRIYFHNREGTTFVIRPGKKFELLATNQLESGHWASAAVADGAFYLRTEKDLYRIEAAK